jgi:hypothetical protein
MIKCLVKCGDDVVDYSGISPKSPNCSVAVLSQVFPQSDASNCAASMNCARARLSTFVLKMMGVERVGSAGRRNLSRASLKRGH